MDPFEEGGGFFAATFAGVGSEAGLELLSPDSADDLDEDDFGSGFAAPD